MTRPTATICIPSHNHARFLPAAIESALAQTLRDCEIVIVDDGSTDGSLAVAESYARLHPARIRVLTHDGGANRGISETVNLAFSEARGRYLSGLPSDDILPPDKLERQVAFLEMRPEVGFAYGYAQMIDAAGNPLPGVRTFGVDVTREGSALEHLIQKNSIPGMTVLIRREIAERVGDFDPGLMYSDWDYWVRAAAEAEVGFMPRPLAVYRSHGANAGLGISRDENLRRALDVMDALGARADAGSGRLSEQRPRAVIDLQRAFLLFSGDDTLGASAALSAAVARDPTVLGASWLGNWVRERLVDGLHPDLPPEACEAVGRALERPVAGARAPDLPLTFGMWLALELAGERSHDRLVRRIATAQLEAATILYHGGGRAREARRPVLRTLARRPLAFRDRRLVTAAFDAIAGEAPGRVLRTAKRRLLGYR